MTVTRSRGLMVPFFDLAGGLYLAELGFFLRLGDQATSKMSSLNSAVPVFCSGIGEYARPGGDSKEANSMKLQNGDGIDGFG